MCSFPFHERCDLEMEFDPRQVYWSISTPLLVQQTRSHQGSFDEVNDDDEDDDDDDDQILRRNLIRRSGCLSATSSSLYQRFQANFSSCLKEIYHECAYWGVTSTPLPTHPPFFILCKDQFRNSHFANVPSPRLPVNLLTNDD